MKPNLPWRAFVVSLALLMVLFTAMFGVGGGALGAARAAGSGRTSVFLPYVPNGKASASPSPSPTPSNGGVPKLISTLGLGDRPDAVAVNPATNKVYVVNANSGTVAVIDGATNAITARITVPTATGRGDAIAVNPTTNTIYLTSGGSVLTVINGASNAVTASVIVGANWNAVAVAVNPTTNTIYVADNLRGEVAVINGATNLVTATVIVPTGAEAVPGALAVNPTTGMVYVGSGLYDVAVIDGTSNTITTTIDLQSGNYPIIAVNATTNTVYAVSGTTIFVLAGGGTGGVTSSFSVSGAQSSAGISVNSSTNTIYLFGVLGCTCQNAPYGIVAVNGSTDNVIATITLENNTSTDTGANPGSSAVNTSTNLIYAPEAFDDTLSVIDGSTNTIKTTVGIEAEPYGIAVNPTTGMLYVASTGPGDGDIGFPNGQLAVIDGATNSVVARISIPGATTVAVNPTTNTVYVFDGVPSLLGGETLTVINGATNTVSATVSLSPGPNPSFSPGALAVNPTTNLVYASSENALAIVNGATNSLITTVPFACSYGIAVDASTNVVYVPCPGFGTGAVSVLSGATNTITSTINGPNGSAIAFNPTTNLVFVASTQLWTINTATNTVTSTVAISNPDGAENIAVNPMTGNLFATTATTGSGEVLAISPTTLSTIATIPVGTNTAGLAVNPASNLVYVVNTADATVSVLSD